MPEITTDAHPCLLTWVAPEGEIRQCGRLKIIHLVGSPEKRLATYGKLISEKKVSRELIDYFSGRLLKDVSSLPQPIIWLLEKALNWHAARITQNAPAEMQIELEALAKSSGIPLVELQRGMLLADYSSWFNAWSERWPLKSLPPLGCTSIAKKFATDNFFYGRNLDFSSAGIWDKNPSLIVHLPEAGSQELRHIAFGSDGAISGGITGVNEAGITVAIHQNFSRARTTGIPMFLLGEKLLRSVKSIEEAIQFLDANRPGPLWTYVITNLNTGEAAAIEVSQRHFHVRRADGPNFAQTNHVAGADILAQEWIRPAIMRNSSFRYRRALELLAGDPELGIDERLPFFILAKQADSNGELGGSRDIMKPHTIQTLVFRSRLNQGIAAQSVSISIGEAPAASGEFIEFSLEHLLFPENASADLQGRSFNPTKTPANIRENQKINSRVFYTDFDHNKLREAADLLATQKSPTAFLYRASTELALGNFAKAQEHVESGRNSLPASSVADYPLRDSFTIVSALAFVAAGDSARAKAEANRAVEAGTDSEELLEIQRLLNANEKIPQRLLKLRFDFFAGNLRTAAQPRSAATP